MPEVQFISRGDLQILLIDLSGVSDDRVLSELVDTSIQLGRSSSGPGSLRTLVDLSNTRVSRSIITSLKRLSQNNGRFAKATAFVGLNTFVRPLLKMMFRIQRKNNHKVFTSRADALLWLEQW